MLIRRDRPPDHTAVRAVLSEAFKDQAAPGSGWVDGHPALGLGPLAVAPVAQRRGAGSALMHAVLGAADALDEGLVALLGHTDYYPRFGFRPAGELGITPPVAEWASHFQVRALSAYEPDLRGSFRYPPPFEEL
jgi:putative acetyltransferase